MPSIYFEDLEVGQIEEYGAYEVTEAEIVEFASQYDPQWFHTDPERAAESPHGGVIASGWHTCAMSMRLLVEGHLADAATVGALGVDELRWPAPVRPGDELTVQYEVLETRPSESTPDRGIVRSRVQTIDADGAEKLSMQPVVLYARKNKP